MHGCIHTHIHTQTHTYIYTIHTILYQLSKKASGFLVIDLLLTYAMYTLQTFIIGPMVYFSIFSLKRAVSAIKGFLGEESHLYDKCL